MRGPRGISLISSSHFWRAGCRGSSSWRPAFRFCLNCDFCDFGIGLIFCASVAEGTVGLSRLLRTRRVSRDLPQLTDDSRRVYLTISSQSSGMVQDASARQLPWRETKNPYHILVSEVMLQQTQAIKVVEYFQDFVP